MGRIRKLLIPGVDKKLLVRDAAKLLPDPARRRDRRPLSSEEVASPVRAVDYVPPLRSYREVGPGHIVQVWA